MGIATFEGLPIIWKYQLKNVSYTINHLERVYRTFLWFNRFNTDCYTDIRVEVNDINLKVNDIKSALKSQWRQQKGFGNDDRIQV